MKTLHILLKDKDRNRELLKDVSDDFELRYPKGVSPATTNAFVLPDLFCELVGSCGDVGIKRGGMIMPPKEILKDLFKGSDKFIVSPIDSSEYSAIEKIDADSVFTLEPSRDAIQEENNIDFVDYPYNVDIYGPKNKKKDILLALSNGKRVTEPVHAIIDTEFVTDDSDKLMSILLKVKVSAREMREAISKLVYAYKHPKPRKTTYKTIRHDCAKRNGRR